MARFFIGLKFLMLVPGEKISLLKDKNHCFAIRRICRVICATNADLCQKGIEFLYLGADISSWEIS
jgi:hypothetical protein